MDAVTMDELLVALRWIRDAAREVRNRGWENAASMADMVDRATPFIARSYELPRDVAVLRGQLAVDCEAWRRLYTWSEAAPARPELRQEAAELARRIVDRSDALLAWLQDRKG